MVGDPTAGRAVRGGGPCGTGQCGETSAPGGVVPAGMVRVPGARGEPARIWCAGWCAIYAQALTDVRGLPGSDARDPVSMAAAAAGRPPKTTPWETS